MKENGTFYILGNGSTLQKKKNIKSISINIDMFNICRKYVTKNEIIYFIV